MQARSGDLISDGPSSRLSELGIVLPAPPAPGEAAWFASMTERIGMVSSVRAYPHWAGVLEEITKFPAGARALIWLRRKDGRNRETVGHLLWAVNPDNEIRPLPSLAGMQLGVGASLLGAGYVTYDYGWLDHGHPWWFDEYDGGAGSALSQPIDAKSLHQGRHRETSWSVERAPVLTIADRDAFG